MDGSALWLCALVQLFRHVMLHINQYNCPAALRWLQGANEAFPAVLGSDEQHMLQESLMT